MACSHTQRFTGAHHMMCLMSSQAELVDHCNVYRWLHDFVRAGHAPLHAQERCICIEFWCKCGLKCQSVQDIICTRYAEPTSSVGGLQKLSRILLIQPFKLTSCDLKGTGGFHVGAVGSMASS